MLVIAIKRGLSHRPTRDAVDEINSLLAYPVDRDDFDGLTGYNPLNNSTVSQIFESRQFTSPVGQLLVEPLTRRPMATNSGYLGIKRISINFLGWR